MIVNNMSVSIRIYTKFGKEHVYTFEGYNTLNNTLTIYSNLGCQDVSLRNFQLLVESNEPCKIHLTDHSNDVYITTECFIEGAVLDNREIKFDTSELKFTNHRE